MTKSTINKVKKTSHVTEKIFTTYNSYLDYIRPLTIIRTKHKLHDRNMGKGYEPTIHLRKNPNGQ